MAVKDLKLFYHFFIAPDVRGMFWHTWLEEQGPLLKATGLPIELNLCMPIHWTSFGDIPFVKQCDKDTKLTFYEKFEEYKDRFYPSLITETVRDTGDLNIYEGQSLERLWEYSKQNPGTYVGYVHTKGVMSVSIQTYKWRQLLNKLFITEWKDRYIEVLNGADVVGALDKQCDGTILSGNFFYAKTDYIATLERPIYTDRYQCEKWILSGNPDLHICHNSNIDHFSDY